MQMKSMGAGAGWFWLVRGIKSGFQKPKTLFGAAAFFLLFAVVLATVQMLGLLVLGLSQTALLGFNLVLMVVSALVYPMLCGGYMRVLDAVEKNRPVSAPAIFEPFSPGGRGGRLALVGIGLLVVYALFLLLVYFTIGHGLGTWYMQVMAMGMPSGDQVSTLPPMPSGSVAAFAILLLFFIFYGGACAIAIGQAALRQRSPLQALQDGILGALKNVLPLLILAFCSLVAFFVFALGVGIVVAVLGMIGIFTGPIVALILITPVYAIMLLFIYQVMVGVMYAIWQDVAGSEPADAGLAGTAHVEA